MEENNNVTGQGASIQGNVPNGGKKNKGIVVAIFAVIAVVAVILTIVLWPRKVNLNDYIVVEFEGYETLGTGRAYFDAEAFCLDYADKIRFTRAAKSAGYEEMYMWIGGTAADAFCESINVSLSQKTELSNGMEVSLVWSCEEGFIENAFNYGITYETETYIVEGLEELQMFNPFDNVTIAFDGIAPQGTATVTKIDSTGVYEDTRFECEPSTNLSNGDTVVVTFEGSGDVATYCANEYGCCPTETEMEVVVEGLSEQVSSVDQISQEALDAMVSQSIDVLNSYVADYWLEGCVVNDVSCEGCYVLSPKPDANVNNGCVYVLLKVNATYGFRTSYFSLPSIFEEIEYYYPVCFDAPIIDPDGNCIVNTGDYTEEWSNFQLSNEATHVNENVRGFETIDNFYMERIQSELDKYTCDTSVSQ